jgi:DNA primase
VSLSMDFDLKERVRMAVDIVDVVGSHLELTPQGRGYVARCPWHDDRRPSLQVNPQRQTWKCWVCDVGGDIFSYVMRRDGVDFVEALKILADKAGIDYQPAGAKKIAPGSPEDKSTLLAAVKFAATAYFEYLENGSGDEVKRARDYLAQRGINDESRQRFQIGFAPGQWSWLLDEARHVGFDGEILKAAGLAVARQKGNGHYDLFRGRLMFPIWDLQDRPISMGGRVIPGGDPDTAGAKYINGPETRLFSKSRQLYGMNLARTAMQKSGEVLVMEGYTDVIAARQSGIEPVVAVLGTALGENHIEILKRFVDRVVLVLDGDEAGRRRADQVLELFVGASVDLRIITLPGGADPADFIAQFGRDALIDLAKEAPDALDHKLSNLIDGIDLTRETHQATAALEKMLDVLAKGGDPNAIRTSQMLVRLARTFAMPTETLRDQLAARIRKAASRRIAPPKVDSSENVPRPQAPTKPLEPITGIDRELFEIMIEYPEAAAQAIELVDPQWLISGTARMLMRVYQDLELQGRELDMQTLMLAIEDERLKGILVSLDESIQQRADFASQPFRERFNGVLMRFNRLQNTANTQKRLNRIESDPVDIDSATELLGDIIAAQRLQQGLKPK